MADRFLCVFLDEAGDFNFSKNGTRFFVLGGLVVERPFKAYPHLLELKYSLIERGIDVEYFHAAEDKQSVRNQVFEIIGRASGCGSCSRTHCRETQNASTSSARGAILSKDVGLSCAIHCRARDDELREVSGFY